MKIITKKTAELVPYKKNAKKHSQSQIDNVAQSIKEYGFVQPVVIDKNNIIVIGHCRFEAAKKTGMQEIPCVCVDELTPEQVKALRIVDNKTNESPWDLDILRDELLDIDLDGFDFDWDLPDELDNTVVEDDYDPELPDEPKSAIGDIYQLGNHRLMCGDSTSVEDVKRLVGEAKIDLLLTDPPYNVDYEGEAGKIKNDNMEDGAFRQFLNDAFANAVMVMKSGAAFYIWYAGTEGYNFCGACRDVNLKLRQCLIWVKNSIVMGRQDYHWKHEPCLYGWKDGKHYFFKNRKQSTILEFPKPLKSAEHPTMKPIRLFDYQIQCSTKPGENVLDLFTGSGTTIMACEQNGRNAYCMEYDPKFVDVIIDRWEKFTNQKAIKLT